MFRMSDHIATAFELLIFWAVALSPVWLFMQLLIWAASHIPA
ncbi:hypothetical protein [Hydrogenophaga sp.]|nr:hypothetical protein [Hydrogenophaga sp.]